MTRKSSKRHNHILLSRCVFGKSESDLTTIINVPSNTNMFSSSLDPFSIFFNLKQHKRLIFQSYVSYKHFGLLL